MTINRHRAVEPSSSPWSTADGSSTRTGPRRLAPFAAALAAAVLMLSGAPAAAAPTFITDQATRYLSIGNLAGLRAEQDFNNPGTNARYTDVSFSTTEWYSRSGIEDGVIWVKTKTADDLNALSSPPPNPFTVTATATMTNDEGETASGTYTIETRYVRTESTTPVVAKPTFQTQSSHISAPPGVLVSVSAEDNFDNAGTNPRFTAVAFTATAFYSDSGIVNGVLQVRAKTAADLNALTSPPPNPFAVSATATMTNDEGETASGTFTFETNYAKQEKTSSTPSGPAPTPNHSTRNGVPGILHSHKLSDSFNNAGTNPRFTEVTFDKPEYLDVPTSGQIVGPSEADSESRFFVRTKTHAQLRALLSPPPSPFTVKATAKMTNDEGHTATVKVTFTTNYVTQIADLPLSKTPSPSTVDVVKMPPRTTKSVDADSLFDNSGTNPRFTAVGLSTREYYDAAGIPQSGNWAGEYVVKAKSVADLKAMDSLPANPIRVTATVTMINDEGATGTRTVMLFSSLAG